MVEWGWGIPLPTTNRTNSNMHQEEDLLPRSNRPTIHQVQTALTRVILITVMDMEGVEIQLVALVAMGTKQTKDQIEHTIRIKISNMHSKLCTTACAIFQYKNKKYFQPKIGGII